MKALFLAALLTLAIFASITHAADEITFAWDQEGIEDVDGWRLYQAETSGGPYTQATEIMKAEQAGEYTATLPKADFTGERFFVVRAFNSNGESADSNEVNYFFDKPLAPVMLRIVLTEATE